MSVMDCSLSGETPARKCSDSAETVVDGVRV